MVYYCFNHTRVFLMHIFRLKISHSPSPVPCPRGDETMNCAGRCQVHDTDRWTRLSESLFGIVEPNCCGCFFIGNFRAKDPGITFSEWQETCGNPRVRRENGSQGGLKWSQMQPAKPSISIDNEQKTLGIHNKLQKHTKTQPVLENTTLYKCTPCSIHGKGKTLRLLQLLQLLLSDQLNHLRCDGCHCADLSVPPRWEMEKPGRGDDQFLTMK